MSEEGEVIYRDKAYHGVESRGYDATMRRGARGHPLGIRDKLRIKRINRKRAPGERPFTVIKRVFKGGPRPDDDGKAGACEDGFLVSLL